MSTAFYISSGIFRGRKLESPRSPTTHPMGSRERLALMNSLSDILPGAKVLDLFAGTGAIGLEALSRGAKSADFVEHDRKAIICLKQNLQNLNIENQVKVFNQSVFKFQPDYHYDLVFADPPYPLFSKNPEEIIITLNRCLEFTNHLFVLSHPESFNPGLIQAELISTRKFASARISTFKIS